jgi:hypothetical protein
MNSSVFCFAQEAIDDRAFPENLPAGAGGLTENDVCDLVVAREFQKGIGNIISL